MLFSATRNPSLHLCLGLIALTLGHHRLAQAGTNQPLLQISPTVLPFSAAGIGTPVVQVSPSISNPGSTPVTIIGFSVNGPNASDFQAGAGSCPIRPASFSAGGFCSPTLTFTPSAVGARSATLDISIVGGATQKVLLVGQGLKNTKALTFLTSEVIFPESPLGLPLQYAPQAQITVHNSGTEPVQIHSASVIGADPRDFDLTYNGCASVSVPAGSYCFVSVAFVPVAKGIRSGALQVTSNAPGGPLTLPLKGVGAKAENTVDLFPLAIAFAPTGTAGNTPAQVAITNTGSKPVTIDGFLVDGANAADFTVQGYNCQPLPYILTVQAQCQFDMQFAPGGVGDRVANLKIFDTATGAPHIIPMQGTGVSGTATLNFNPDPPSLGALPVGQQSYNNIEITNEGPGVADLSFQIQGAGALDFTLISASNLTLGPGQSGSLFIIFTPSQPGIRQATIAAINSASGQRQSMALVGAGLPAGTPLTADLSNFAPTGKGATSSPVDANIFNQSQSPVTITGITLTGAAKDDFAIVGNNCQPTPISYDCYLQLTFTPTATGPRVAQLQIAYDGGSSPMVLPLAALGLPLTRAISFGAPSLEFTEAQPVGVAASAPVTVSNAATDPVTIDSIKITGPDAKDYALIGNECPQPPATLEVGSSCNVNVQFTPSETGARQALLTVADNAEGSPQNLRMTGFGSNGVTSVLDVNTSVLNFSPQTPGSSNTLSMYLYAFGSQTVSLSSIRITGPNAADFKQVNNCGSMLSFAYECQVNVTFTPSVIGSRLAELEIRDNAAGSPQIIPLAGLGVKPSRSIGFNSPQLIFPQAQAVGYPAYQAVNVFNLGNEDVHLSGFQTGGADAHEFGIQSNSCPLSPAPLSAGEYCTLNIVFQPSKTGTRLAELQVKDDAQGSPQSIALVGEGVPGVKALEVTPAFTFGPISVGSTEYSGLVYLNNLGSLPVTLDGFTLSGADAGDFSIQANFCNPGEGLAPGTSCEVYLDFTPSATGKRHATLTIQSDAPHSPFHVQLSGVGE